jgi:hypothetical protein
MVAHQAVSEDAHPRTLPSFFQNLDERGEIPRLPEDVHPAVAAVEDVEYLIVRRRPRSPGHRFDLRQKILTVNKHECPTSVPNGINLTSFPLISQ